MRRLLLSIACLAALPGALEAQEDTLMTTAESAGTGARPFVVTPFLGAQLYDGSSAIRRVAAVAAIDATYRLTPQLGIGLALSAARPRTDGEFFPLVRLEEGTISAFYRVSQRVTHYTYGLQVVGMLPGERLTPYVAVGGGGYLFDMNPQEMGGTTRYSGPMFSAGAGVNMQLGARTGFALDVRDVVLMSFERNRLDATDPLFRDPRFDQVSASKPAPKSVVHNLRLSIGVSFIPDSKERAR